MGTLVRLDDFPCDGDQNWRILRGPASLRSDADSCGALKLDRDQENRDRNRENTHPVEEDSPFAPEVEVNPKASFQPIDDDNPATVTDDGTA